MNEKPILRLRPPTSFQMNWVFPKDMPIEEMTRRSYGFSDEQWAHLKETRTIEIINLGT